MTAHQATPDAVRETPTTDLQSLRALMEEATPRPWTVEPSWAERCGGSVAIVNREHPSDDWDVCSVHSSESNAALIAAAVNALPTLLSIAEAYANAPIVHDVTGRHGFIGHHVRIVPCDADGEPTTGGRGDG